VAPGEARGRRALAVLWLACTLFIVYGGAIPFRFTTEVGVVSANLRRVTPNPLVSPDTGRRISIPDVVQNVLLYVPFGFLGVATIGRERQTTSRAILLVIALAALLSTAVEILQLFTTDRTTSVADVLANALGALAGAAAAPAVLARWRRSSARPSMGRSLEMPAFYLFGLAMIVICLLAWAPFDVTLDVGAIWSKVKVLESAPWRLNDLPGLAAFGPRLLLRDVLPYLLLTFAGSLWIAGLGVRPAAGVAAVAGVALAAGLEVSKLVIESRLPHVEDAAVHAAGAAAGAAAAFCWTFGWTQRRSGSGGDPALPRPPFEHPDSP
jgi:VanZ family protein